LRTARNIELVVSATGRAGKGFDLESLAGSTDCQPIETERWNLGVAKLRESLAQRSDIPLRDS
jgi:hypothetical protein